MTPTMWAMAMSSPGVFRPVTVPRPNPENLGPGQALVRVLAGGICGSDLPYLRGLPNPHPARPVPGCHGAAGFPLHELAGEVLAADDPALRSGDRVVGWAESYDGLAEVVVTKAAGLAVHDPDLTPTRAVLAQPLACVLYAVERIGDVRDRVCAVLGLGPIGLLFAHVLAERGAARVVGVDPVDRRAVAGLFGLDHVVARTSTEWAAALPEADRPDVVVEAVGHQVATLTDALHAVRAQGSVFYFGVPDSPVYPIDMASLMRKNLTLRGGVTLDRRRMLGAAEDYLARHPRLGEGLVTDMFGRGEVQAAYDRAAQARPDRLKVVLNLEA